MPLSLLIQSFIIFSIPSVSWSENQFYRIQPHDVSALVGSNITIPCVIALPHGDVQWTKDGLALGYDRQLPAFPSWSVVGDESQGEYNFLIQSLKLEDEGIFACEVSPYKDAPALKQVAHVRALVQPQSVRINEQPLTNETNVVAVRFDEKIRQIHCQVDAARPAAHTKWFNATGYEFPATSRTYTQNRLFSTISTLTFVPSLIQKNQRFTCHVHHETLLGKMDKLYTSVEVQITSPPSIPVIHGYTSTYWLLNGSYLTLSCYSYGGSPLGSLAWYRLENDKKQLKLIDNSSVILQEKNLTVNNISMIISPSDNNATFSCHVTNDYLSQLGQALQTNITLQVAFGPSLVRIRDNSMNTTTLIEGNPQQFQCRTASSNPRPIVVWKLNGQLFTPDIDPLEEPGEFSGTIIQTTKTLGLEKSLKEYHQKILSCEARNPDTGHIVTDSTELNIIYDATSIEMHGISQNQLIKSGDTIRAECVLAGGHPLGRIVWYKGGDLLQSEYVLEASGNYATSRVQFTATPSDNNLPLTCKGQVDNFPQKFASFMLNVTYLPAEITIIGNELLSNLSISEGGPQEFECRASLSNPHAQLKITRQTNDGQKHTDIQYKTLSSETTGMNSIKFMLPQIDRSLHGNLLTCEAILDVGAQPLTKQITYVLNVNHKPYFREFHTLIEMKENQSFNITLEANAYPLPITYQWFHPSGRQLMNDQLNIFVDQGQLALANIQRNDAGVYRCVASNLIGSTEVNFTLSILYGPTITRTQGYSITEALMPGSSAILLCVVSGNPLNVNNTRWFKDNEEVALDRWEKHMEGYELSLIGKSVQREDVGQYICEIDNQLGSSRATLPLVVQYAPEIDRTDPSRSKAAADADHLLTAELHCHVSALPKPTIVWLKNNQELPLSSPKYQMISQERPSTSSFSSNLTFEAVLYVANVTKADYGIYRCKAENKLGTDMSEVILTGLTVPDPPSQVQIVNTSHSSLLITWLPGFDGGSPQTFQLRYRQASENRYAHIFIPAGSQSFDLKNLRLGTEYYVGIRSNNSHYLSEWSDDFNQSTSSYLPTSLFHSSDFSPTKYSFTFLIIIALIGLLIVFINVILISFFLVKRRRLNAASDNSSTTGTNETEANTVDIFQPIPSNFFLPPATANTYQKYDDDDLQRPFVASYSAINLSNQESCSPTYGIIKKDRLSTYDNFRTHQYYPANVDSNIITYRSFREGTTGSTDLHECIRAELV